MHPLAWLMVFCVFACNAPMLTAWILMALVVWFGFIFLRGIFRI